MRGATRGYSGYLRVYDISTHAPLAGRDERKNQEQKIGQTYFNPRAPCGARPLLAGHVSYPYLFQPTRPLRGATFSVFCQCDVLPISTHAPLAGRDFFKFQSVQRRAHFNPRAPCGARPLTVTVLPSVYHISTHAPLAGRDGLRGCFKIIILLFQPTRPLRGATKTLLFR